MLLQLLIIVVTAIGLGSSSKCSRKHYSCADCNRVRVCQQTVNGYKEVMQISCYEQTPYCGEESGSCSFLPPWKCASKDNYPCMRDGVFPNPSDCNYYRECRGGISKTFRCTPHGNHFDAALGRCRQGAPCIQIDCNNKHGVKVPHPANARYFAYCMGSRASFVDQCPQFYELDKEAQECRPKCTTEGGKVPDHSDFSHFFVCSRPPGRPFFNTTRQSCLLGSQFEPVQKECVKALDHTALIDSSCCCGCEDSECTNGDHTKGYSKKK